MKTTPNGWEAWYRQWDEIFEEDDIRPGIVPFATLAEWGESFRQYVMLNDHWINYAHPEPMSLEDGMSIAFVLYDAGVDVDELLDVLDSFEPFEDAPVNIGIPLCWLTEPMDHVQDLLGMANSIPGLDPEMFKQMNQMVEEMLGESPVSDEELPELFRSMVTGTASWLITLSRIMGDNGLLALRAWWQGRLIALLRDTKQPRRGRRQRPSTQSEIPSAFRDLVQGLDFRGISDADEE